MEAEDWPRLATHHCGDPPADSVEPWLARMERLLPRAMSGLPFAERYVICAYFFDEQPLTVLARDLELPPAEVSALIQSALQQLRGRLLL